MSIVEVKVPDIGDFKEVEVIELMVKPGDTIKVDQSLVTVESDKASMEIPSSHAGVVKEIKIKVGDKVAEGSLVLLLEEAAGGAAAAPAAEAAPARRACRRLRLRLPLRPRTGASACCRTCTSRRTCACSCRPCRRCQQSPRIAIDPQVRARTRRRPVARAGHRSEEPHHASRRAELRQGRDGGACRRAPSKGGSGVGLDLLPWPSLDFSKFGPTELLPLSRIKKISGPNLHRNWVMIPHVTHVRRSGRHRPGTVPRRFERVAGQAEVDRQADHAGLRDQGIGRRAEEIPAI